MTGNALSVAIRRLAAHESLDGPTVTSAFDVVMRGEATPTQVAALLMALRVKGETAEEIAGVVSALRAAMIVVPAAHRDELVDTCGTGGGSITTFNISTAAALLAAGLGVRVAKHGNRSFTSRSGSADVLEALGVTIEMSADAMAQTLSTAGIVFMFAPLMHPALRHVGPVRRELGIPTVMNIVGPLANPAQAGRQVVGVAEAARVPLLAEALRVLGTRRALVVHGAPGLDEISPLGPTEVSEVEHGSIRRWHIDPAISGVDGIRPGDLAGEDPETNASLIQTVLSGGGPPGARAAVILNAAAAIYVGGQSADFERAVQMAAAGLRTGAGMAALERLRNASAEAAASSK